MAEQRLNFASKISSDYDKIAEIEQTILQRQKNAEMVRAKQKDSPIKSVPSLSEEFFEGLRIV